jgi:chorismate mutase
MDISGLVTVAVAVVAGGSALLGAWLTSFGTHRQVRQQWKLQQIEKWRETRSHRLEELYYKIDHWRQSVRDIVETHEDALAKRLTRSDAIARLKSLHAEPDWDVSRVNQLVDVYAPDLKGRVTGMLINRRMIISHSRSWIEKAATVYPAIEGEFEAIEEAMKHITKRLAQEIRRVQAVGRVRIEPAS